MLKIDADKIRAVRRRLPKGDRERRRHFPKYVQLFEDRGRNLDSYIDASLTNWRDWHKKDPDHVYLMICNPIEGFYQRVPGSKPGPDALRPLMIARRRIAERIRDELVRKRATRTRVFQAICRCLFWLDMLEVEIGYRRLSFAKYEREIWTYAKQQIKILERFHSSTRQIQMVRYAALHRIHTYAANSSVPIAKLRSVYRKLIVTGGEWCVGDHYTYCRGCVARGKIAEAARGLNEVRTRMKKVPPRGTAQYRKHIQSEFLQLERIVREAEQHSAQ